MPMKELANSFPRTITNSFPHLKNIFCLMSDFDLAPPRSALDS
jgi:hypothetical protein